MGWPRISDDLIQAFCRDYETGMSSRQVAKRYGVTKPCVLKYLHLSGIKVRPSTHAGSRYRFNAHYFNTIDNEHKAYWLGMLAADGCVVIDKIGRHRLNFGLKYDDVGHVQAFLDTLESDYPIYVRSTKTTKMANIQIGSGILCQALIQQGVTPRKSLTLQFPSLTNNLVRHYIRGYVDGDGSIMVGNPKMGRSHAVVIVCGGRSFLKHIQGYTQVRCDTSERKVHNRTDSNAMSIHYYRVASRQLILHLYSNATVYLPRKWVKARQILGYSEGTPMQVVPHYTYQRLISTLQRWRFEKDICQQYCKGSSATDIASLYGTYNLRIYRILERHGIPRRSRKEYWVLRKQRYGPTGSSKY